MFNFIPVKVRCIGKVSGAEGVSVFADGKLWNDNLSTNVEFEAKDEDYNQTKTTISISGNTITVTKVSDMPYSMVFERGKSTLSMLNTPTGVCQIIILCKDCSVENSNSGVDICIRYTLSMQGGGKISDNDLEIKVTY